MQNKQAYEIRTLNEKETQTAVDWAAAEGWNPGLHDAGVFFGTDPEGFLGGFLEGELIATVSAVRYGNDFAFLGFYIVKPEFRGSGYGMRICEAIFEKFAGRNLGLDGVVEQQENYKESGFTFAYRNIRYQGQGGATPETSPNILELNQIPFEKVVAYDSLLFFAPRPQFLQGWISQPESKALGYVKNGQLQGYGVVRQCFTGCKIGPLFADNAAIAGDLYAGLAGWSKGQAIFLDVPEPNAFAMSLAKTHAMTPAFETARMYNKQVPSIDLNRVFGVTSFELG